MAKRAIIRSADNAVDSVSEWDGITPWQPRPGTFVLSEVQTALPGCQTGAIWTGSGFSPAPLPTPLQITSLNYAVLVSVGTGEKPATVRRTYQGSEFVFSCYVTQAMKDDYTAGKIKYGDYVLVGFLDDDKTKPIIIGKVFKSRT